MTYTVTSFGKAFADVRNSLLKKSTCIKYKYWGILRENDTKEDSASFVQKLRKDVIQTNSIFQHVGIIYYLFSAESYFDRIAL